MIAVVDRAIASLLAAPPGSGEAVLLSVGTATQIAIDAWPGRQWRGHVDQIGALSAAVNTGSGALSATPDPAGMGDITLRIAIDGGGAELLPGMAAAVMISAPAAR